MSVEEDYKDISVKNKFIEKEIIKKDLKSGAFTIKGVIANEKVLLKIISKSDTKKAQSLNKEYSVDRLLYNHNKSDEKLKINYARVLNIGENDKYLWVVRKYYSGKSLARYNHGGKPLLGYDEIQPEFEKHKERIIEQVVKNLKALSSISLSDQPNNFSRSIREKRFEVKIDDEVIDQIESILGINLKSTRSYFDNSIDQYLNNKEVASYSDLVLANIIISDKVDVIFSDFEWFCADNNMMDVAFLWVFLWRYPKWQDLLIKSMISNNNDKLNFRIGVIRLLYYWFKRALLSDDDIIRKKHKKYFSGHKWSNFLFAAGESFDELVDISMDKNDSVR